MGAVFRSTAEHCILPRVAEKVLPLSAPTGNRPAFAAEPETYNVLPPGIEPRLTVPETVVLSIKL